MRLAEVFYSIQGEGPAMGRPATFIRLAGCNLSCAGCDTDLKPWQDLAIPEVQSKVTGSRVIITGGEPTLQMSELAELIRLLCLDGKEIHIESNGTNLIPEEVLKNIRCVVISPKRGSGFHLDFWSGKRNVHLKFVMGSAPWCWTSEQLEKLVPTLARDRVWLMAYGAEQDMAGAANVWDLALRLGVNYSDRLHIRMMKR
ncbi:7-carboxy-7-deazaguanine synthase [uncultured archaeon]|nr:7-carboxy-7-deazaguanine synthase [uncultured archaeon]